MSGGNDGLNTVVPYEDDVYHRNRSTLVLPEKQLHKIGSSLGFHPRMGAFAKLYKEGYLSIVQGVGSVNPQDGHEEAMRIWHTGDPERPQRQTGWIGRAIDGNGGASGVFVGPIVRPFALNATRSIIPSITSPADLVTGRMPGSTSDKAVVPDGDTDNGLFAHVRQCANLSRGNSQKIQAVLDSPGSFTYPDLRLARHLRTVAQLIRADVGIRVFFVEIGGGGIGGFDNHANQLGNHCALLEQLSESIGAFVSDLKQQKLLDQVLLMTFSEFGRTVSENGRRGTGHGIAAPVFLVGGKLKGGLVGEHPSLTDLNGDSLKLGIDFRCIYATVLERWLGFDSKEVLGGPFEQPDVFSI